MSPLLLFLLTALAVVGAAVACLLWFRPRLRARRTTAGRASIVTLVVLLVAPALAVTAILWIATHAGQDGTLRLLAGYYFYAAYGVGLACFIATNRYFRRLGRPTAS